MEVSDNTQVIDLAGQSTSACTVVDVADSMTTAFQWLQIGTVKYKLANIVDGFMNKALFDK